MERNPRKSRFWLDGLLSYERRTGSLGQHLIVAQAKADIAALSVDDVVSAAQETLPSYMIPEAIGIIDTLPLSRNGKVDRAELKRLPLLGRTQSKNCGHRR